MRDLLKQSVILLILVILWDLFLIIYAAVTGSDTASKCAACVAIPAYISAFILVSIADQEGR